MGFASGLVLTLSGEWELFELQRQKWKSKSNLNPKWFCPQADGFRPLWLKSLYNRASVTIEKYIFWHSVHFKKKALQKWGKKHFSVAKSYLLTKYWYQMSCWLLIKTFQHAKCFHRKAFMKHIVRCGMLNRKIKGRTGWFIYEQAKLLKVTWARDVGTNIITIQ